MLLARWNKASRLAALPQKQNACAPMFGGSGGSHDAVGSVEQSIAPRGAPTKAKRLRTDVRWERCQPRCCWLGGTKHRASRRSHKSKTPAHRCSVGAMPVSMLLTWWNKASRLAALPQKQYPRACSVGAALAAMLLTYGVCSSLLCADLPPTNPNTISITAPTQIAESAMLNAGHDQSR